MKCSTCGNDLRTGEYCPSCAPEPTVEYEATSESKPQLVNSDEHMDETLFSDSTAPKPSRTEDVGVLDEGSDNGNQQGSAAAGFGLLGCGIGIWIGLIGLLAYAIWGWKNPWLAAVLTLALLIMGTLFLRRMWLRGLVGLVAATGVFFWVSDMSVNDSVIVTSSAVGPYSLGQSSTNLANLGVSDAAPGELVKLPDLESVRAQLDTSGLVTLIDISTTNSGSPRWQNEDGISAYSSIQDFRMVFPSAQVFTDGWDMAWAPYGDNAIMLTKYGPEIGQLAIGRKSTIQAEFTEAAASTSNTSDQEGSTEYGRDDAYRDILTGCLNEAAAINGSVSNQDRQFCEQFAQENANAAFN